MSNKETTLKEKFKLALTSTAKVISDDFDLNSKSSDKKKQKEPNIIAEYYQRCFGEDLPESLLNIQIK